MSTQDLGIRFAGLVHEGYTFDCQPIPGEVDVLQIVVDGNEEIPIYLSETDTQVLCIAYLWTEAEVKVERRAEMLERMLELNIPIPLSAFSKIGDRYVLFGALSCGSGFDDIVHEVLTLSENATETLDVMEEFLR
jgi:uncharacterized protein YjfI (DUF2170 family)